MKKDHLRITVLVALAALAALAGSAAVPGQALPDLTPPKTGKIPVAVVVTRNANLMDFAGPWEVFANVKVEGRGTARGEDPQQDDQYPFDLYMVGDTTTPVRIGGLTVVPQFTFDEAPTPRIVIIGAQAGSPKMKSWLQKVAADPRTDLILSVCTGAFKLAGAGLLDGKPATTHHAYYAEFEKYFPKVKLRKDVRFVRCDAHTFTAGGLTSGIDLGLHIVELYYGKNTAQTTADWIEYQGSGWHSHD